MKLQKIIKDLENRISDMEMLVIAKTNIINIFLGELYDRLPSAKDDVSFTVKL